MNLDDDDIAYTAQEEGRGASRIIIFGVLLLTIVAILCAFC